ncbi:MAG TPA: RNA 2',3'-cyclic phosphodiesterase [Caulobacteraceae bacterium]|nr:RNA 2',3'-cyclic phosphodiesterase [Caulobacteraceae bacterium]
MIRLFAAVGIPEHARAPLEQLQHGLPGARWRPPESFHITLRYAGEVAESLADDLDAELAMVGADTLEIAFAGVGSFDDDGKTRSVWAGVRPNAALEHLAARCETGARRAGLRAVKRSFRPHITLAYLREVTPASVGRWITSHNLFAAPPFSVESFGLFSSRQTAEGSHYRLERDYPLRSPASSPRPVRPG